MWDIEATTGYKLKTTFWDDFSIADKFGINAIKDTYKRAFAEWKTNYVYLTELVLVLNHKAWEHYTNGNESFAQLYNELWQNCNIYAHHNLKGEELSYFYTTTD